MYYWIGVLFGSLVISGLVLWGPLKSVFSVVDLAWIAILSAGLAGVAQIVLRYLNQPRQNHGVAADPDISSIINDLALLKEKIFDVQAGSEDEESGTGVGADPIVFQFTALINRLEFEVSTLERRSNVNVIIGILSALVIVLISSYVLVFRGVSDVLGYLPLLSIVLVIELFSIFFLRLYKKCLDDIKFFRNEISNFESMRVAYLIAREHAHDKMIAIVDSLMAVERNFVLKKDESTVDIERAKLDVSMLDKIVSSFGKLK